MARKRRGQKSGRLIAIIDDHEEYLASTEGLLRHEGHDVLAMADPTAALMVLHEQKVDLILVDYVMPQMTGEELIRRLRTFDPRVQIILQTGYANEQPPRELLARLDIQGYVDKSEGPDALLLWVDVGLKSAAALDVLERRRLGLERILGVTRELHRAQPLDALLHGIRCHTRTLVGAVDALVVTSDRLSEGAGSEVSDPAVASQLVATMRTGQTQLRDGSMAIPMRYGEQVVGAIYVDSVIASPGDRELLEVYAGQAAVAVHEANRRTHS